ncbi:hypothetical protein HQQ80_11690 [Microbacteriaceae bacterium VKM Ac-2855]|nr:hypothetical protein [Microbacteriaceae bacterium VKM Ac-2855]
MTSFTPLPGEPASLAGRASSLLNAADAIRSAGQELKRVADSGEYTSEAVDAIRADARDLGASIMRAHVRYVETAEALLDYAPKLHAAQDRALRAIADHARTDIGSARGDVNSYRLILADPLVQGEDRRHYEMLLNSSETELQAQKTAASAAEAEYQGAVVDRDRAANEATARISGIVGSDELNDSMWDDLAGIAERFRAWAKEYLSPFLAFLDQVLTIVSIILGVLAVILAFIPGLQPIALLVGAAAMITQLIQLGIVALQVALGDRPVKDFIFAAIGAIVSLLTLKLVPAGTVSTLMRPVGDLGGLFVQGGGFVFSKGALWTEISKGGMAAYKISKFGDSVDVNAWGIENPGIVWEISDAVFGALKTHEASAVTDISGMDFAQPEIVGAPLASPSGTPQWASFTAQPIVISVERVVLPSGAGR